MSTAIVIAGQGLQQASLWAVVVAVVAAVWVPVDTTRSTLTGHTGPVVAVAISPDGTWLATASHGRTLRIWDAVTGRSQP